MLAVLSFNLMGDGLRDALDPQAEELIKEANAIWIRITYWRSGTSM